jgi:hypothetical protein
MAESRPLRDITRSGTGLGRFREAVPRPTLVAQEPGSSARSTQQASDTLVVVVVVVAASSRDRRASTHFETRRLHEAGPSLNEVLGRQVPELPPMTNCCRGSGLGLSS